jgi:molybdopterin synthase sulfur carrier subunit
MRRVLGAGREANVLGMSKLAPSDRRPSVRMLLHGAFREFAGGARDVTLGAGTIREALDGLVLAHPTLAERLRDERGTLRPHLALFINQDDARLLGWEDAPLRDGDIVHIIPALSGG